MKEYKYKINGNSYKVTIGARQFGSGKVTWRIEQITQAEILT